MVDCSADQLPTISQTLTALDADYTLDASPEVLAHLRTVAHRTLRATGGQ